MKSNSIEGRNQLPADTGRIAPMEHVLERIQTLTAELKAVQVEIYGQITEPAELMARRMLLEDGVNAEVLEHFRAALDQVRSALWLCTEESAVNPSHPRRRQHNASARGVLRTVSGKSAVDEPPARRQPREAVSFFDRLDRVIDNYMQEGGSIINPDTGKRPKP